MALMDIFNGFRSSQSQQATTPSATTPGSQVVNPTVPSTTTPQSDGSTAAIPAASKGVESPLDGYKDLWKLDATSGSGPQATPTMVPNMNVDPNKIMEVARQIDFTKGMDAETLQKAAKGDAEAFATLFNKGLQDAYAQGALASTRIVQSALQLQDKNFNETVMPSILRKHSVSQAIAENPLSANPAAAPLLKTLEQQFAAKYPTASPAEISKHAESYLSGLATEIVRSSGGTILPKDNASASNPFGSRNGSDVDWEAFFGEASSSSSTVN